MNIEPIASNFHNTVTNENGSLPRRTAANPALGNTSGAGNTTVNTSPAQLQPAAAGNSIAGIAPINGLRSIKGISTINGISAAVTQAQAQAAASTSQPPAYTAPPPPYSERDPATQDLPPAYAETDPLVQPAHRANTSPGSSISLSGIRMVGNQIYLSSRTKINGILITPENFKGLLESAERDGVYIARTNYSIEEFYIDRQLVLRRTKRSA